MFKIHTILADNLLEFGGMYVSGRIIMRSFMNLNIKAKLRYAFGALIFIIAVIGVVGYIGISTVKKAQDYLYANDYIPLTRLSDAHASIMSVRADLTNLLLKTSVSERQLCARDILNGIQKIDDAMARYRNSTSSNGTKPLIEKFNTSWARLKLAATRVIDFAQRNQNIEAMAINDGEIGTEMTECQAALVSLKQFTERDAERIDTIGENASKSMMLILTILLIFGLAIAGGGGFMVASAISKSIATLVEATDALAKGDVNVVVDVDTSDEIGKLSSSFNILSSNIRNQASEAEQIALGNLNVDVRQRSDVDILAKSRNRVVEILKFLLVETNSLTLAAREGKLNVRGDADRFSGGYREIIDGMNKTLDAIVTPIQESADVLSAMATGDLTVRMKGEYKGDHQLIKNSVNSLAESLSAALRDVSEVVSATSSASAEISSSTEEMAAGAQEQNSQTAEVAGAVEEMTSTILENSKSARHALETAKKARQVAEDGGNVVQETVHGMNRIAEVVKKSAGTVQALGKSSDQIGEIIQVIDDIADQTNLLALNAAIEAARAGDQGRGFAVVADEVRKLAERTVKATKEIAQMIKKIQADTVGAVKSMEEGTHEVDKGIELAQRAGSSLKEIVLVVSQLTDMATQIAAGSEQQSGAAEQISKNIEGISSVTHESASGTQQIARAAEDLNQLTNQLQHLVAQFNTGTPAPASSKPAALPRKKTIFK